LSDPAGHGKQGGGGLLDVAQHAGQRLFGYVRVVAERKQHLLLAFEFLQQVGFEVGAPGYLEYFEQRQERDMMVERIGARDEMARALEQILQAQQGPDALVERILVRNDGQTSLAEGRKCEDSE
jgi:hypothetical protein